MTKTYYKHSDIDSEIQEIASPWLLLLQFFSLAIGLSVFVSWLVLAALLIMDYIKFYWWLFCLSPILLWLVLGIPMLIKSHSVIMVIMDMFLKTAEAWAHRAGYSIDLNKDGFIGWQQQPLPAIEEQADRLIPYNTAAGTRAILADEKKDALGQPEAPEQPELSPPKPIIRQVKIMPNGEKIETAALIDFCEQAGLKGHSRALWVDRKKVMTRDQHTGLMMLLESLKALEGRKPKYAGKLVVSDPEQLKAMLGLLAD